VPWYINARFSSGKDMVKIGPGNIFQAVYLVFSKDCFAAGCLLSNTV